jgi:hypothetical protein
MENVVKKLVKSEKGAALILVLVVLLVGGLIAGGLLQHMGAGLLSGEVYGRRTAELYAADAGVESAIWKIQHPDEAGYLPCNVGSPPANYTVTDINGGSIQVFIHYVDGTTYKVTSVAIANDGGNTAAIDSSTAVEAYVTGTAYDYSSITDHILCSQGELEWGNKVSLNYSEGHGPADYFEGLWPTPSQLTEFYWQDVGNCTHYYGDTEIDLKGGNCPPGPIYVNDEEAGDWSSGLGPLYVNGELDILNSINAAVTLTLNGTLYITGDTRIGSTGHYFTLDLNGQTIFVESNSADALVVGGKCTVKGPGCIIAVGDVYFAPKGDVGGNQEPVFIFSVSGTTKLQPSGDFYGAIAGSIWLDVQTGNTPTIIYPPDGFGDDDINFPGFGDLQLLVYDIASWEITQQ